MSIVAPPGAAQDSGRRLGEVLAGATLEHAPQQQPSEAPQAPERRPASVGPTSLAAGLSAAAAAFVCAGLFDGIAPRLMSLLGAGAGAFAVWVSYRARRTGTVQILIAPVALVAGSLAALIGGEHSAAELPSLVSEALRTGGIALPPVAFDPGWRFLLVVLAVVLGGAAAALGAGLERPKVGVFLPMPVVFAGLAAQSTTSSVVPIIVAVMLIVGALAVSFGVELAREGATSGRFEIRRLARGAASLLVLIGVLGGLTQVGFLFPEQREHLVIPPRRPEPSPPEPDRQLFTVRAEHRTPWRVGVLDVYDGRGWLTPPFDPGRLVRIGPDGSIGEAARGEHTSATFAVADLRGHSIPVIANVDRIIASGLAVEYDPRTQTLRLPRTRAVTGVRYTVAGPELPRGVDLARVKTVPDAVREFLDVPPPPPAVAQILAKAPRTDGFSRLQFVRDQLYSVVVAKGEGKPVDVPPTRIAALLQGQPGTPFEIAAAEAVLARWAGVPSRIGYGYFGGDRAEGSALSIRPRHGATWLEVYFDGYGWIPIVGTPPRAQSSLSPARKNENPTVRPAENLTITAYVPVRVRPVRLMYAIVQYWVARAIPALVAVALAIWLYPGAVKMLRRRRRAGWGRSRGIAERIRVAYANFRDVAQDFNIGHGSLTPLEFLDSLADDREHRELAWLVTRCLWGDLARDLRGEDAELSEEMARSLVARLRSAQPLPNRVLALASRRSLRSPFTLEVPNLWWPGPPLRSRARLRLRRVAGALGSVSRALRRRVFRRGALAGGAILLVFLISGCVRDVSLADQSARLPERLVPDRLGAFRFERAPSTERAFTRAGPDALVGDARVYSIHRAEAVVGALQVGAFKSGLATREREVRAGILESLGGGRFELERVGTELVYTRRLPEQRWFLWFPPKGAYYELLVAPVDLEEAGPLFADVLAYQRGAPAPRVVAPPLDPRRGSDG